jgi:trimethylamine:corrinoid methyltransferase-like protein
MASNYYCTLDKEQVTRVHEASLEVLQKTGIRASHGICPECKKEHYPEIKINDIPLIFYINTLF